MACLLYTSGQIIQHGATDRPDGIALQLGGRGAERFVRADFPGIWRTPIEIGTRIFKDYIIGFLGDTPIIAPFDGMLRGVVRDLSLIHISRRCGASRPPGRGQ